MFIFAQNPGVSRGTPFKKFNMAKKEEINLRINMPMDIHDKVVQVQGLLTFKEKKKPFIHETYKRLLEIGIAQFMKNNRL